MMEIRAAAIQLNSKADKARNVHAAERLVREAAADGAELIALPEKWNVLGDAEALHEGAEPHLPPELGPGFKSRACTAEPSQAEHWPSFARSRPDYTSLPRGPRHTGPG